MDKENPNYYAIIPADVRYDTELSANEKLLYGEISALCNKFGYCYATSSYFAELYNVDIRTIRRWIERLAQRGYIISEINRDDVQQRKITLVTGADKNVRGVGQKCPGGADKNVLQNNINNNNTRNIPLRDINNTDVLFTSLPPKGAGDDLQKHWEKFWTEYIPVKTKDGIVSKGSKKLAEKKYKQLLSKGVKPEDILRGLRAYLSYCQNNGRLTCGVAVFLNQERWKDDYGGTVALAREQTKMSNAQSELMRQGVEFLRKYGENNESGNLF